MSKSSFSGFFVVFYQGFNVHNDVYMPELHTGLGLGVCVWGEKR